MPGFRGIDIWGENQARAAGLCRAARAHRTKKTAEFYGIPEFVRPPSGVFSDQTAAHDRQVL
jgi:hypothetical protein